MEAAPGRHKTCNNTKSFQRCLICTLARLILVSRIPIYFSLSLIPSSLRGFGSQISYDSLLLQTVILLRGLFPSRDMSKQTLP